ncbi:MAG: GtrA family protein, partial [Terracidiphilus sp.]
FSVTHNILASLIAGRVSSLVNYILNRRFVFMSRISYVGSLWRYYLLAVAIAAASYGSIRSIYVYWHWNVLAAKIVAETILSLASFAIQQTFVFPGREER